VTAKEPATIAGAVVTVTAENARYVPLLNTLIEGMLIDPGPFLAPWKVVLVSALSSFLKTQRYPREAAGSIPRHVAADDCGELPYAS
jgi:hypothetical protein